jgi:alpha/beta superfamily hydrolase
MRHFITISLLVAYTTITEAQIVDTIYIQSANIKLHTVLSRPEDKMNIPLAIIIAGSGPTDLNGNQPAMQNNSLRYLSDALNKNHIATLRFDKRAIAKSSFKGLKEADLRFEDYVNDVVALIEYFKTRGYKNIYVIGHSEGSLIGMAALQHTKSNGFVSIAGMGNPADRLLKKQLKPKLPAELYSQAESVIDSLKSGNLVKNFPLQLVSLFRPSVQPYLISWFKYDPAGLIKKLNCPVMILQGDKDIQVDIEEANILKSASKKGDLIIIKNMNHVLKIIAGDIKENMASYTNPDLPISKDLVDSIVKFIIP